MTKFIFLIFSLLLSNYVLSQETCSRVAIINYQDVLVDTNSTQKGEGLRYHLEKDEVAKKYLDKYQEGSKIKWSNAALGSAGTIMVLSGIMTNSSKSTKNTLLVGGASLILINFLVAKTLQKKNEENLTRAIEEYNKRNLPRIYFGPDVKEELKGKTEAKFFINKTWSF